MDSPGETLAGAASAAPARALPGQLAQRQQSAPPLSPRVPTPPTTTLEPRLGRDLHDGMQIFVKIISTQDQMRTRRRRSSTRSLPRKSTRPLARSLPGTTTMPRQDPCRGHLRGHSQTHVCQDSTAVPITAACPTSRAGTCMATCGFQASSASTYVVACKSS